MAASSEAETFPLSEEELRRILAKYPGLRKDYGLGDYLAECLRGVTKVPDKKWSGVMERIPKK